MVKTVKDLDIQVSSIQEKVENNCKLNQSILLSLQNIDSRLDGFGNEISTRMGEQSATLANDLSAKLDTQAASLSETLVATTISIKNDIAEIRYVIITKLQVENKVMQ